MGTQRGFRACGHRESLNMVTIAGGILLALAALVGLAIVLNCLFMPAFWGFIFAGVLLSIAFATGDAVAGTAGGVVAVIVAVGIGLWLYEGNKKRQSRLQAE